MTEMIVIIIVLMAILIGLVIRLRKQAQKYEEKSVKETMSPIMHSIIRRERTVNYSRKERFEKALSEAARPAVPADSQANPSTRREENPTDS